MILLENMIANNADAYDIKKWKELLEESSQMMPNCFKR